MKVVILYHPDSEKALDIETYAQDYTNQQPGNRLELVSLETRQGADMANLYGITVYPALLAISEDGHLLRLWQGDNLPLMNELTAYSGQ